MPGKLQCPGWRSGWERSRKTKKLISALQDQFVHIWRYEGGYKAIDENMKFLKENKDYNLIMKDMSPLLRSRESELFLQFSFWPDVALRCFSQLTDHNDLTKGSHHSGRDLTYTSSGPTTWSPEPWWSGATTGRKPSNSGTTSTLRRTWDSSHRLESFTMWRCLDFESIWDDAMFCSRKHRIIGFW